MRIELLFEEGPTGGRVKVLARITLCLAVWLGPALARAEVSALLVGVGDYAEGSGIDDLKGPPNDVRLLGEALASRGVRDITVLADHTEGAARPTRAAILAALSERAGHVGPGDLVYVHLSGHGSRQKDLNGDETDGQDEVFLPADATNRARETGLFVNAITDDEIGAALDAIRATGADVWLVMDSCNSGTGLRAGSSGLVARYVDPPTGIAPPMRGEGRDEAGGAGLPGGIVAFYAAQSTERAHELDFGGTGATQDWYGLFSSQLAARLADGGDWTFRQLFQAVLADMNDRSIPGGARLQTPLWEGDLIDRPLFGAADGASARRFPVERGRIGAGQIHGMLDGTLVGLLAEANGPAGDWIGRAQLSDLGARDARLTAVSAACRPEADAPCPATGQLPADARFAEVIARPVDLAVVFAPPVEIATGAPLAADHTAHVALLQALDTPELSLRLDAKDYDVAVGWDGASLWFGPRVAIEGQPIGLRWTPGEAPLAPLIARIARAETMAHAFGAIADAGSIMFRTPVPVAARVAPVASSDLAPLGTNVDPTEECLAAVARRAPDAARPLTPRAELKQCDTLSVAAQGTIAGAYDVNRIHIDAHYCVHADYARVEDTAAAVALGQDVWICSDCAGNYSPAGYSAGEERMFIVVGEAAENAAPLNLTGLVETCDGAPLTRGARAAAVDDFLTRLTRTRSLRGGTGFGGAPDIWVEAFDWTVVPKAIALAGEQRN
ncbi:MAG: hypothetical protein CMH11_12350 [Maritimibacter sp.]|nr:hypothetical protein [Maritimibacter sp.]